MTVGRPTLVLVLVALFLAALTTVRADACPKPKYKVTKPSPGQRVGADQKVRIRFDFKNPFNATLDNYVIRMAIPIDKITYESYNVLGHTAKKKATTTFATEPDGSVIAWTLYNMPAGNIFTFLIFVTVRDCAALGITSFPISSYLDVDGVPLCPIEGPAPTLRIVMPKKSKTEGRPPAPTGCPTPSPTPAPTPSPTPAPTPFPSPAPTLAPTVP